MYENNAQALLTGPLNTLTCSKKKYSSPEKNTASKETFQKFMAMWHKRCYEENDFLA